MKMMATVECNRISSSNNKVLVKEMSDQGTSNYVYCQYYIQRKCHHYKELIDCLYDGSRL